MSLKRFALLTSSHEGSALAYRAKREGLDVLTGVLADWSETYTPAEQKEDGSKEEPLEKERRLKTYSGMVPQVTPQKLISSLSKLSLNDQQETFAMVDMNYNFKYALPLKELDVHGNFPLVEDRILESDREKGKEFVKEFYTDLKLGEVHDFTKIQDALDFLEENMSTGDQAKLWVLKGNDAGAETIVPLNEDTAEQAYQTIKTALEKDSQVYEGKGFILEEFIKDAIEITPQCVFYNGVPLLYSVDIEIKKKGSGLSGRTTGCAANVVFRTSPDDPINKMAFPPKIYQMAKERKGLFIWDASILVNPETDEYYFGEFCCNRFGYDCTQTEMTLAGGVTNYFERIMKGEAPYEYGKFGFAVRIFNEIDDKDVPAHVAADVPLFIDREVADYIWPLYVYDDGEGLKSSGYGEDLAIVTCVGDTIEEAAAGCYEYMEKISFKDYSRLSLDDVLSRRYAGSILNRFDYANGKLYNVSNGEKENVTNGNKLSTPDFQYDIVEKYASTNMPINPMMTIVNGLIADMEKMKQQYDERLKKAEQAMIDDRKKGLEKVRGEIVRVQNAVPKDDSTTKLIPVLLEGFKDLKSSLGSLQFNPTMDMTPLAAKFDQLANLMRPLENNSYLVKISDKMGALEQAMASMVRIAKEPKTDTTSPALVRMFGELKKELTENFDRMIKTNKETVTVVGGGRPSRQGLINVAYDSVDVTYPTTSSEVYTFKVGTNSPNGSGNVIAVVTVVYTDSTKTAVSTVRKV